MDQICGGKIRNSGLDSSDMLSGELHMSWRSIVIVGI